MIRKLIYLIFRMLPIRKNRVLFIGYYGSQYGCNPKYISRSLTKKHNGKLDITWAFTEPDRHEVAGVRKVRYGSLSYLLALATAKVICTNYRMTTDFIKRYNQIYIQTWHSSLRLKKIEADTEASLPAHYIRMAKHDSAQTDFVIAGCNFSHNTFRNSFWYSGEILDFGTPRNDLLLAADTEYSNELKKNLGVSSDTKIVLYAPTFRKEKSTECYKLNFKRLTKALYEKYGGDWIVVLRLHPHLLNCELFKGLDNVVDATKYDDIQELLCMADVLVSDYSSLIFDFALTGRPVFLFATDLDSYIQNDRSLYFDLTELPFPVACDNEALAHAIQTMDDHSYAENITEFNKQVGSYEDGKASDRIADLILKQTIK